MGFGRNSSRIANQKLANYKDQSIIDIPSKRSRDFITEDEEYDEDQYEEIFY